MNPARRTHGFRESVIRGMTRLAREYGSLNLAQGFPNFPAPELLKAAAAEAVREDINQYAITWGSQKLREALGINAAIPIGVMLGRTPRAACTEISDILGSRSASSRPISNRMASTRKYATGFALFEINSPKIRV